MSIYSTIEIPKTEAIKKIAQCLGVCDEYGETAGDSNEILSKILFQLTKGQHHKDFNLNNFIVIDDE